MIDDTNYVGGALVDAVGDDHVTDNLDDNDDDDDGDDETTTMLLLLLIFLFYR